MKTTKPALIELTFAGTGLKLEKVSVALAHIASVQKPDSKTFGCIISLDSGEKFPVQEDYDKVMAAVAERVSI